MSALVLASTALACSGQPASRSGLDPAPAVELSEPAPHYQGHPDVPPDELGAPRAASVPERDGGVEPGEACATSEPPPYSAPPRIASGPPVTNYIPPAVIMRPIRALAGCFRGCYQAGLARNPALSGRIAVRFVIDLDGWVRRARVVDDELGDRDVADCVRRAFVGLQYDRPEGGAVTVVYPLTFAPSR